MSARLPPQTEAIDVEPKTFCGNHRLDGTLGQRAVADLAAAGTADAAGFAHGEIGKVVVQDELFFALAAGVGIKFLRVFGRAEGGQDQRLGFAAAEQGRAVRPRQEAHLARQRANIFKSPAIHPLLAVQNQTTHGLLLEVIRRVTEHELGDFFRAEFFHEPGAHVIGYRLDRRFAREFARYQESRHHAIARQRPGFAEDFLRHHVHHNGAFGLAGARGQLLLGRDDRPATFAAELQRRVEVRFGDFLRGAFEHDHFLFVADIDQVEVAFGHLGVRGIGHELPLDAADADRAQRSGPGNIADHQRRRGADDAEDVGIVFSVGAEQDALHLDFVVPSLGERGPDGPVNHPAGEDFLLRRAAFALEVTAGKPAGRGRLLAIIHRQREEFLAGLGVGGGHGGDDDDGFPQLNGNGAVGLFGEFAGFNDNLLGSYLDRYFF